MDPSTKSVEPRGSSDPSEGEKCLVAGRHVALRMWSHPERTRDRVMHSRPYETVGYVLEGRVRLHLGAQTMTLVPGSSYVVPAGADHTYEVIEAPFRSLEAISPPPHPHSSC